MKSHYDIVWPFGVPPVSTGGWDDAAWTKWLIKFRPEGYKGGAYDKRAWAQYLRGTSKRAFMSKSFIKGVKLWKR